MTPEERAELDRLLDLAEKERLLEAAPSPEQVAQHERVLAERLEQVVVLEREFALVRDARQALAPDADWID